MQENYQEEIWCYESLIPDRVEYKIPQESYRAMKESTWGPVGDEYSKHCHSDFVKCLWVFVENAVVNMMIDAIINDAIFSFAFLVMTMMILFTFVLVIVYSK